MTIIAKYVLISSLHMLFLSSSTAAATSSSRRIKGGNYRYLSSTSSSVDGLTKEFRNDVIMVNNHRNNKERALQKDDSDDSGDDGGDGTGPGNPDAPLGPDECYICGDPAFKGERPTAITFQYKSQGENSKYHTSDKSNCLGNLPYPESASVTITYGDCEDDPNDVGSTTLDVTDGAVVTLAAPVGGELETNTCFNFGTFSCYIHTSCSQPLVTGDQIGFMLLLAANDCAYSFCGDGIVNGNEQCEPGLDTGMVSQPCRDDCTIPDCGDGIVDADLGEDCDFGDMNGQPGVECSSTCTKPICGDGIVDENMGEECDDGKNGDDTDGCKDDCTFCKCEARASYDDATGAVTIDFDLCGAEPMTSDFIGIYPCNAETRVANTDWWTNTVCSQFPATCNDPFAYGYEEGRTYVNEMYYWFAWTCGSPEDGGCQTQRDTFEWPSSGSITIDPSKPGGPAWPFRRGRSLPNGCYVAHLQREIDIISPPPFPDICGPFADALKFYVPSDAAPMVPPPVASPTAPGVGGGMPPVASPTAPGVGGGMPPVASPTAPGAGSSGSLSFVSIDVSQEKVASSQSGTYNMSSMTAFITMVLFSIGGAFFEVF